VEEGNLRREEICYSLFFAYMRFHIENFGCRAARADGEAVSATLCAQGLAEASLPDADLVLLNTCSVTAEADRDARAFIRKTRRNNPQAKIVVTGCYAQRAPEEVAALEGVTAVVGNSHKALLPTLIPNLIESQQPTSSLAFVPAATLFAPNQKPIWADDQFAHSFLEEAPLAPGIQAGTQTRPNLKIQEGCGNRCTFCIIPTTRGHSRSLPAEKLLAQIRSFVANGGHELVLSGINLGRWGRDLLRDLPDAPSFPQLLRQIIETTELARLRLSSIEPMDWTPDLIRLLREYTPAADREGRIARHAHLPLQSGSDSVLRRMHRRYRPWHYEQKVAALTEAIGPQLALGADVMIGFPGETDAEFRATADLIQRLPFTYLHLFPFSPRPGTPGWQLHQESPVAAQAVHERMAHLRALAAEKSLHFRQSQIGCALPAITLHTPAEVAAQGHTLALTDNFLSIEIDQVLPANQLTHIRLVNTQLATLSSF
jgi:threonylcarbamoyladenosine tRNA methylthiotransferase MtaB